MNALARRIVLVFLSLALFPAASLAADAPQFFSPTGVWNAPLAGNAALASNSSSLVGSLNSAVKTYGTWINTNVSSTPIYTVPTGQPTVRVTVTTNPTFASTQALQRDLAAVPLPAGALPGAGADASLVISQPSTNTMWEFWQLKRTDSGWTTSWGGKMTSVSTNTGIFPAPYGATATSLPTVGGLMLMNELAAGSINHAVSFAMPYPAAGKYVYPAQRTDGNGPATSVPEGTRFRLPASLNIDAMKIPPFVAMLAKAVQRYGMILNNRGDDVAFFAEDPTPLVASGGINPYPDLFWWLYPNQLLSYFPWSQLQAVKP
jgi:hypothetical protein